MLYIFSANPVLYIFSANPVLCMISSCSLSSPYPRPLLPAPHFALPVLPALSRPSYVALMIDCGSLLRQQELEARSQPHRPPPGLPPRFRARGSMALSAQSCRLVLAECHQPMTAYTLVYLPACLPAFLPSFLSACPSCGSACMLSWDKYDT